MRNSYFILVLGFVLFFGMNSAYAATDVTISTAAGSGAPGCESAGGCYHPSTATVDVGGKVIMKNTDTAAHTFTAGTGEDGPSGEFDTGLLMAGNSFEYSPSTVGEINYFCMVHPWMQGLIIVKESSEPKPTISVWSDKSSYKNGDTIKISGKVTNKKSGIPVSLILKSSNGNLVSISQHTVASNGAFSATLDAGGTLMKSSGTYTFVTQYGTENISASGSFYFSGTPVTPPPSSSSGKITVSDISVSYSMTGGKLYSIIPDINANSLIVSIDATSDGSLKLHLPRTLIDAKIGNSDDDFFVLIDGESVDFNETTQSTNRILTVAFPAGAEEIEVIGTFVISNPVNTAPTPKPYVPTPSIPSSADIIIPSGTGAPGCEDRQSCYLPYKFSAGVGSTVTWFNADTAAHTVTSGTPEGGPSGEFDSGLFMSGNSFSHKFSDNGTYPYFCMVHPWMSGYVIVQRGGPITSPPTPIPTPTPTPTPTISVSTDGFQYSPSDLVTVKVSTSQSANVAVSVVGPNGDSIVSRSVSTDSRGNGSLQFKLPDSSASGTYRVDTTATISGNKVSDSMSFTVKSNAVRMDIVSLQPTDQQGNAVSSFTKGKLGFVKVMLNSDSNASSLVTINLFDDELTSLGIGSFKTTLGSGQSEMTLSFFIPNDASSGNGDIYANVFSDWPSQGGVPLTGESSTQVRIQ
ncbi:MAG: plastocyanin/azurin family copper-binding protein [Candidatus Nitrosopumilus sp. bin_68KS]